MSGRTPVLTDADEARDPLTVLARGAEELGRDPSALEEKVDVVLPGEPDAAEDLYGRGGDRASGVGGARLGHRRGEGKGLRLGAGGPGRVVGERARLLDVVEHLRAAVGDRLIGADRSAELLALLRVLDGHVHGASRDAGELGGQRDAGAIRCGVDVAGDLLAAVGRDLEV